MQDILFLTLGLNSCSLNISVKFAHHFQKGFTLIELLVVIAILGVLAAAIVATINPFEQLKKSEDATVKNAAVEFSNANIRYFSTHDTMPWGNDSVCLSQIGAGNTLSNTPDCLKDLTTEGELKQAFKDNKSILDQVFISSCGNTPIICYNPLSEAQNHDVNTRFNQYGATRKNCPVSNGVSKDCYWCSEPSACAVDTGSTPATGSGSLIGDIISTLFPSPTPTLTPTSSPIASPSATPTPATKCLSSTPPGSLTCSIDWSHFPSTVVSGNAYTFPITFYSNFGIRWPSVYWMQGGQTIYRDLSTIKPDMSSASATLNLPTTGRTPGAYVLKAYLDDACAVGVECNEKAFTILPSPTPTPAPSTYLVGYCAVIDSSKILLLPGIKSNNGLSAPDLGNGYARIKKVDAYPTDYSNASFLNLVKQMYPLCSASVNQDLMKSYCSTNSNPAYWDIEFYKPDGSHYGNSENPLNLGSNSCASSTTFPGLENTKLYRTYAMFSFDKPSFGPTYHIDVSLTSNFSGSYPSVYKGFAWCYDGEGGTSTSPSEKALRGLTAKLLCWQSLPYNAWIYNQECGKTIYWRVVSDADPTVFTASYPTTEDCSTKVDAFPNANDWYKYYSYINSDGSVRIGQPYDSSWDPNGDGKIDWTDYWILAMQTKFRAGGWSLPE
jgi:prepilin-type N-terminal cleavage/methylation domain-containing protein